MPARVIRGYQQGQDSGAALVTVDDAVLGLPAIDPKREMRHSPDGFQWGYAGSGPAELARAILVALYPEDPVVRHPGCYQRFKFEVIAGLPRHGFTLHAEDVERWYQGWRKAYAVRVPEGEG